MAMVCWTSGRPRRPRHRSTTDPGAAVAAARLDGRQSVSQGSLRRDRLHGRGRSGGQSGRGHPATPGSVSYGGVLRPPHSHRPKLEALKQIGEAFNAAPVVNNYGTGQDWRPTASRSTSTSDRTISTARATAPTPTARTTTSSGGARGEHSVARGGESVDEMDTVCECVLDATKPWVCQYALPASSVPVRWDGRPGSAYIQDKALSITPTPPPTDPPTPLDRLLRSARLHMCPPLRRGAEEHVPLRVFRAPSRDGRRVRAVSARVPRP